MALIVCSECGGQVSDRAPHCPHCGLVQQTPASAPIQLNYTPSDRQILPRGCLLSSVLIVGLIMILAILTTCSPDSSRNAGGRAAESPSVALGSEQENLLRDVKDTRIPIATRVLRAEYLISKFPASPESTEAAPIATQLRKSIEAQSAAAAAMVEANRGKQWSYGSQSDEMSSKKSYSATVSSTNSFNFDFPYQGSQRARLTLRKHPRWGNDVLFSIERGQILCHTYSDCTVRVRFDDGAPQTFQGTGPEDNSSETVFIPGYAGFSSKLAKAKTVRVEVNVYHQGSVTATFDVDGFDSDRLAPAR